MSNFKTTDILTAASRDAAIAETLLEQMLNDGSGGDRAMLVLHQVSRLRRDLEQAANGAHEQEVLASLASPAALEHQETTLLTQHSLIQGGDKHEVARA
ncbi:hypothetical protein D3C73_284010 [compost metagenome]